MTLVEVIGMNRIAKLIPLVLWFLLAMNCPVRGAEVGEPLPDFSVQTFDGKSLTREATVTGFLEHLV